MSSRARRVSILPSGNRHREQVVLLGLPNRGGAGTAVEPLKKKAPHGALKSLDRLGEN